MISSPAASTLVRLTIDRANARAVVVLGDGTERSWLLSESPFPATSRLNRLDYLPHEAVLRATTVGGDVLEYELPAVGQNSSDAVAGRMVVYLDQNQWSAVSNALHGSGRPVPADDSDAALRIAELARQRRIILPASAGHLMETSQWTDAVRRYQLGLTVASLSRGWQMRNPLQVRGDELHDTFRRRLADGTGLRMRPVFTLAPEVLFTRQPDNDADSPFGAGLADGALSVLRSATVSIDLLLDSRDTQQGPDGGWAAANQQFSDRLDSSNGHTQQKRLSIDGFLLSDLRHDVATQAEAAGITPSQMTSWMRPGFGEALRGLGSLAFYREVVQARHLNRGTVWTPNDLTDMVFLSCAAAYADMVVCERHMADPLRQAFDRLGKSKTVYRRLRDALPAIEMALDTRPSQTSET